MAIAKGDTLPQGKLVKLGENGPETVEVSDLAQGRVAIFAVPGAYTPTCSAQQREEFLGPLQSLAFEPDDEAHRLAVLSARVP